MDYRRILLRLYRKRLVEELLEKSSEVLTEVHHINYCKEPLECRLPEYPENTKVRLTRREHCFVHLLLYKIWNNTYFAVPALLMNTGIKLSKKQLQELNERRILKIKEYWSSLSGEERALIVKGYSLRRIAYLKDHPDKNFLVNSYNGSKKNTEITTERNKKYWSENLNKKLETLDKMNTKRLELFEEDSFRKSFSKKCSEAGHKRYENPEERKKQSERLSKMLWYNNGVKCIRIKSGNPIPEGYVKGRLPK